MNNSRFDLFDKGEIIIRQEKVKPPKRDVLYMRFTVYNSRVEFSKDLIDKVFDCCNSIRFAKVTEDDEGNEVDWLFVKGYKGKVSTKNLSDAHPIKTIKRTGRKYLDLNKETLKRLNEKLIRTQGGVKSRVYNFYDENSVASKQYQKASASKPELKYSKENTIAILNQNVTIKPADEITPLEFYLASYHQNGQFRG